MILLTILSHAINYKSNSVFLFYLISIKNHEPLNFIAGKFGPSLQTVAISRHYELLYNMGVQLLHCGKIQAAFDCLIQAVQVYQTNPRLWLRLAECCITNYREV